MLLETDDSVASRKAMLASLHSKCSCKTGCKNCGCRKRSRRCSDKCFCQKNNLECTNAPERAEIENEDVVGMAHEEINASDHESEIDSLAGDNREEIEALQMADTIADADDVEQAFNIDVRLGRGAAGVTNYFRI